MALAYCEICGVLIPGGSGQDGPEGVICADCFDSRQVLISDSDSGSGSGPELEPVAAGKVQFECVYCRSLLRLPAVSRRTNVKCPQCTEAFFLNPDGRVEARLEGNTTAIISKEEALKELSGVQKDPALATAKLNQKTQPIAPVSQAQKAALKDLAAKNLDVVQDLPPRDLLPVDSRRRERSQPNGPTDDTAVELDVHGDGPLELRASDEGRVDLDVESLRKRTKTRRLRRDTPQGEPKAPAKAKAKQPDPGAERARRERHERRDRRQAEATRKAQELQRTQARRSLGGGALVLLCLLPVLVGVLLLSMTVRGQGFATRGQVGDGLEATGARVEAGVRHLDDLLGGAFQLPKKPRAAHDH